MTTENESKAEAAKWKAVAYKLLGDVNLDFFFSSCHKVEYITAHQHAC